MAVVTDERLVVVLAGFEARVDRVLQQISAEDLDEGPGLGDTASPVERRGGSGPLGTARSAGRTIGRVVKTSVIDRVVTGVRGDCYPGAPGWSTEPADRRARWWVDRISIWAAGPAALPWAGGRLSDRLPIKDALSAAAQGLVVCAVSREYGVLDADRRISLLAEVLTGRRIDPAVVAAARDRGGPDDVVEEPPADLDRDIAERVPARRRGVVARAGRSLWSLARAIRDVQGLLDGRQHGGFAARAVGMLPGVGVLGGYVAERTALARAGRRTEGLLGERFGIAVPRRRR